ncbi:MAG: hypothetical protein QM731_10790 [Chitinophagaceae bacterium]
MTHQQVEEAAYMALLVLQCLQEQISAEENLLLENWLNEHEANRLLLEEFSDPEQLLQALQMLHIG